MLIEVRQPYVDVSAQDLSLTLGAPPAPALDVLHVTAGGLSIELRLLGFSHQALVHPSESSAGFPGARSAPDGCWRPPPCHQHEGGTPSTVSHGRASGKTAQNFRPGVLVGGLSETVACVPGVAGSLPPRRTSGGYDFRARVERHADADYAARAAALIAAAADDPRALAGVFADAPGAAASRDARLPAFTALAARPLPGGGGIAWTTWHGYPQSGEIVVTASSLERAG